MYKRQVEELVSESKKIPQEVKDWLLELLQSCRELQKRLNKISKYLKEYADNDEICQKIMSVPGIGPITATRLKATIGDIQRFEKPKSIVAYYGLVPKSKATGHNEKKRRHNSSRRSSCPFSSDRGCGSSFEFGSKRIPKIKASQ